MRSYDKLLECADVIVRPRGYMDGSDRSEIAEAERKFAHARRAFVYSVLRRSDIPSLAWPAIEGELNRITLAGAHDPNAVSYVRSELKHHFSRQAGRSAVRLFIYRWGWLIILALFFFFKIAAAGGWISIPGLLP